MIAWATLAPNAKLSIKRRTDCTEHAWLIEVRDQGLHDYLEESGETLAHALDGAWAVTARQIEKRCAEHQKMVDLATGAINALSSLLPGEGSDG